MAKPDSKRPKKKDESKMTEPSLDFEYLKDVPIRATVIGDTSKGIHVTKRKKNIVEFAPPEPETNICPLCGDAIPDDTLRSPKILCEKCKRPIACVGCKEEILDAVGITECPWCHTEPESTEKIQHALRVREEKKTYEEEQAERYKFMTEYATARTDQAPDFPAYGEGTPYSTMTHAMAGIKDKEPDKDHQDKYPHRDGPDVMSKKGGWGPSFDIPSDISVSPIKEAKYERLEREQLKEEAQRATGRSTQRRLSALNHLIDRVTGFIYGKRKVLFIVDTQEHVRGTRRGFEELRLRNPTNKYVINSDFIDRIDIRTIANMPTMGRHYTLVVFDLVTPIAKSYGKKLRMDVSVYGCPIIGGESIVEEDEDPRYELERKKAEFEFNPRFGVTKSSTKDSEFKPKVILDGDEIILPAPATMDEYKRRSRKEKPPRTALRCMKCGQKPSECACDIEPGKREWAKPSRSLTTTLGGDSPNWKWVFVIPTVTLFAVILVFWLYYGAFA